MDDHFYHNTDYTVSLMSAVPYGPGKRLLHLKKLCGVRSQSQVHTVTVTVMVMIVHSLIIIGQVLSGKLT